MTEYNAWTMEGIKSYICILKKSSTCQSGVAVGTFFSERLLLLFDCFSVIKNASVLAAVRIDGSILPLFAFLLKKVEKEIGRQKQNRQPS
jgi:hypothetical protein